MAYRSVSRQRWSSLIVTSLKNEGDSYQDGVANLNLKLSYNTQKH